MSGQPSRAPHPCSVVGCRRIGIGQHICNMHRMRARNGTPSCVSWGCERVASRGEFCPDHAPVVVPYAICDYCSVVWVRWGQRQRHCYSHVSSTGKPYCYVPRSHLIKCIDCGGLRRVKQGSGVRRCLTCASVQKRALDQDHKHRRRVRLLNGTRGRVDRKAVFARDRWRCQLCGGPVRRDVVAPHPEAPSLDHIVPLAVGGSHEYANVQLAHFICNSRKGARHSPNETLVLASA